MTQLFGLLRMQAAGPSVKCHKHNGYVQTLVCDKVGHGQEDDTLRLYATARMVHVR